MSSPVKSVRKVVNYGISHTEMVNSVISPAIVNDCNDCVMVNSSGVPRVVQAVKSVKDATDGSGQELDSQGCDHVIPGRVCNTIGCDTSQHCVKSHCKQSDTVLGRVLHLQGRVLSVLGSATTKLRQETQQWHGLVAGSDCVIVSEREKDGTISPGIDSILPDSNVSDIVYVTGRVLTMNPFLGVLLHRT